LCAYESLWKEQHPALADAAPDTRGQIAKTLLDLLRRELAVRVDYLDATYQEQIRQRSNQKLIEPWAIDEGEVLTPSSIAFPRSRAGHERREHIYISARGGFGRYLRRGDTLPHYSQKLTLEETTVIVRQLFEVLRLAGLV